MIDFSENKPKDITDIVENLISQLTPTLFVNSIVDNLDNTYLLQTCNSQHLSEKSEIDIDGETYEIISVTNEKDILISGNVLPTLLEIPLEAPSFFTGQAVFLCGMSINIAVA